MNPLLARQIKEAAGRAPDGKTRLTDLLDIISRQYDSYQKTRPLESQTGLTETRIQRVVEAAPDAVVLLDDQGRVVNWNRQATDIFGLGSEEASGRDFVETFIAPAHRQAIKLGLERHIAIGKGQIVDQHRISGLQSDGSEFPLELAIAPLNLGDRNLYCAFFRDVTEHMQSEVELAESEDRYRVLFENAPEAMIVYDVDEGRFIDVNENAAKLFRLTREEFLAKTPVELSPKHQPDGRLSSASALERIGEALAGGLPVFEWVHLDAAGEELPCEVRFVRMPPETRNIIRGSVTDLRTLKKEQAERRETRERLRSLFDNVLDGVYRSTPEGQILQANRAFCEMLGYGSEIELKGVDIARDLYADPGEREEIRRLLECDGEVRHRELRLKHRNGSVIVALMSCRAIRNDDGAVVSYEGTLADITARQRAEEERSRAVAEFERIAERSSQCFWSATLGVDGAPRYTYASPAFEQIFGYTPDELYADCDLWMAAVLPEDRDNLLRVLDSVRTERRAAPCSYRITDQGGTMRWLEGTINPVSDDDGRLIGFDGVLADVTERIRAADLLATQRLILEMTATGAPVQEILEQLCQNVETLVPESIAMVLSLDRGLLSFSAGPSVPENIATHVRDIEASEDNGACARAAALGETVIIPRITEETNPQCREFAEALGAEAMWTVPILATDGEMFGTFSLHLTHIGEPDDEQHRILRAAANLCGIVLERARSEEARARARAALQESERRFRAIFNQTFQLIGLLEPDGRVLEANQTALQYVGCSLHDVVGQPLWYTPWFSFSKDARRCAREAVAEAKAGRFVRFELEVPNDDGLRVTLDFSIKPVTDESGRVIMLLPEARDISERKEAERAIFEEKERAQVTLESIGDAVITTDAEGRIDYMNPIAEQITGWSLQEAQRRPIAEVFHLVHESTGSVVENPVLRCLREGRLVGLGSNAVLRSRSGEEVAIQDSAAPIRDREGELVGVVMVFHDVSEERQLHRRLSHQASHDALTGLINRREFEHRLESALSSTVDDDDIGHVLLYMDLDQFKVVNDTCGHTAGDQLLEQIAGILKETIRSTDVLARLGGDEFSVLLQNCPLEDAIEVAESLRRAVHDYRFIWKDRIFDVTMSIGLVPISNLNQGTAGVLSAADVACYAAKDMGRNRVHVYREGDATKRHEEMQWVSRVTEACEQNRLVLFHQALVPVHTEQTDVQRHYELLLRMTDKRGQLVLPRAFLPAAERYNLMTTIDRWVVEHTLRNLVDRGEAGKHRYTLAVNLSGSSIGDEQFLIQTKQLLEEYRPAPGAICFEIAEAAAITKLAQVEAFMNELKKYGCLFSLDDFGSALSSLAYLKTLPIDYLKIDGHLIRNIVEDSIERRVVDSIHQIGHALGVRTVAEEVESPEVVAELVKIGIDFAQGFYFGKPARVTGPETFRCEPPHLSIVRAS